MKNLALIAVVYWLVAITIAMGGAAFVAACCAT